MRQSTNGMGMAPSGSPGKARITPGPSVRRDVDKADAQAMCDQLTTAMKQIHDQDQSTCSFQQLHYSSYQLVLHSQGAFLYQRVSDAMLERIRHQNGIVRSAVESHFLRTLSTEYKAHTITTERTSQMLMFFNKNYCVPQNRAPTKAMAMRIFGDEVLKDPLNFERFRSQFLAIVGKERSGELNAERLLLRDLADMMLEVDHKGLFEALMESPYLTVSREFYRAEALDLVVTASTPAFISQFIRRIDEERMRVEQYLEAATMKKIAQILVEEYLRPHQQQLLTRSGSGCSELLSAWRTDELRDLFYAFKFSNDLPILVEHVSSYFSQVGMGIVLDQTICQQPNNFVESLISLKSKIDELTGKVFTISGQTPAPTRSVEMELNRVFEAIVNKNQSAPEIMSLYLDQKLRASVEETELETACDNIVTIFRFLQDKDMFETAYKCHLSRRLLAAKVGSSNEDSERVFIAKLKKECGMMLTNKIEGMFNDRRTSVEINEDFQRHVTQANLSSSTDMYTTVLTSGFWPPSPILTLLLPKELVRMTDLFTKFYLARHKGRRLEFQHSLGTVDVRMFVKRRYELNVPTMCIHVLLLFSEDATLTPAQVAEEVKMEIGDTIKALAALTRSTSTHSPVLKITDADASANVITPSTPIAFNADFRSRHAKVKIVPVTSVKEKEAAQKEVREKIDDDRKYKIDAAIVRIMKSRRTLQHRELLAEVQNITKRLFIPTTEEIKRRIELLIEREFIDRAPDSRNVYIYKA